MLTNPFTRFINHNHEDRGMILQVFTDYLCTIESDHVMDFLEKLW